MKFLSKVLVPLMVLCLLFSFVGCKRPDNRDPNTLFIAYAKTGYGSEWLENALAAFQKERRLSHDSKSVITVGYPLDNYDVFPFIKQRCYTKSTK